MQRVVVTAVGAGAGRPVSRLTVVTVVTATEQDLGVYVGVYTCIYTFSVYTRVYESKTSVYHKPGDRGCRAKEHSHNRPDTS